VVKRIDSVSALMELTFQWKAVGILNIMMVAIKKKKESKGIEVKDRVI
jgi:hypothetical protein